MAISGSDLYKSLAKALIFAAALLLLLWFLRRIEVVILATLLALIFAIALNAPVTWLEKHKVPRAAGTGLSFLGVVIIAGLIGWIVVPRLAEEIPVLIEQVPDLFDQLTEQIMVLVGDQPEIQRQMDRLIDWLFEMFGEFWRYADVMLGGLVLGIFMVALLLYMVANIRPMLQWYIMSMAPHLRDAAERAFARTSKMVIGWVFASVILGGIKAGGAFLYLALMNIPGALVWSALAFFGAFVPRVGFYAMTIPPVLVSFTLDPVVAVWTFLFYLVFSEILGNFVAPKIYAETMEINAVLILFMTVAMGFAFGVIGVLIATPISGALKAYYDEFFLARRPQDGELGGRVERMVRREV